MSSSVTGAVEGDIDEAVLEAIAGQTGFEVGVCHVTRGQARWPDPLKSVRPV